MNVKVSTIQVTIFQFNVLQNAYSFYKHSFREIDSYTAGVEASDELRGEL